MVRSRILAVVVLFLSAFIHHASRLCKLTEGHSSAVAAGILVAEARRTAAAAAVAHRSCCCHDTAVLGSTTL